MLQLPPALPPPLLLLLLLPLQESSQGEGSHLGKRHAQGQSMGAGPKRSKLS
jgi:hypothetical protein